SAAREPNGLDPPTPPNAPASPPPLPRWISTSSIRSNPSPSTTKLSRWETHQTATRDTATSVPTARPRRNGCLRAVPTPNAYHTENPAGGGRGRPPPPGLKPL